MTATVAVLHPFKIGDEWFNGPTAELDDAQARELERAGYVDVLSVDGAVEVWLPCCSGEHDHD